MALELILLAAAIAAGVLAGMAIQRRADKARNAARAECVACPYQTAGTPLSAALSAAQRHRDETAHPVMVVSAWT